MREGIRGRREPFEISTSGNLPTYLHVHTYVERASINRVSPPTNDGNHRFHQPYALPRQHTRERAYSFSTRQTFYPEKLPRMAEKIIVPRWNEGRSAGERGSLSLSAFSPWRRHDTHLAAYRGRNASSRPRRRRLENACTYALRLAARRVEAAKGCATKGKRREKEIFRGTRGNSSYPRENSFGSQLRTSRVSLFLLPFFLLLSPPLFFPLLNCYVSFSRRRRDALCSPLQRSSLSFDASFDSRAPRILSEDLAANNWLPD